MTIPNVDWTKYKEVINEAHNSLNQEVITWHKWNDYFDRNGEDTQDSSFTNQQLHVLVQSNFFRTWPIAEETASGTSDIQSATIFINLAYLGTIQALTPEGIFDFNQEMDRFTIRGIKYICKGHTPVAQAGDEPLLMMVNLQREEKTNG